MVIYFIEKIRDRRFRPCNATVFVHLISSVSFTCRGTLEFSIAEISSPIRHIFHPLLEDGAVSVPLASFVCFKQNPEKEVGSVLHLVNACSLV